MQPRPAVARQVGRVGGKSLLQLFGFGSIRQKDKMMNATAILHLHAEDKIGIALEKEPVVLRKRLYGIQP